MKCVQALLMTSSALKACLICDFHAPAPKGAHLARVHNTARLHYETLRWDLLPLGLRTRTEHASAWPDLCHTPDL